MPTKSCSENELLALGETSSIRGPRILRRGEGSCMCVSPHTGLVNTP